jgi:peptide/nickel transport system substrate-binding protein
MINNIYRGLGELQNSPMSVQSPYYDKSLVGYDYNPEKARQLLLAAGFKYNAEGRLLDAQGNVVKFILSTSAGNKIREAMGAQIKEDLDKLGIQVDYSPIAFGVLVDKLSNSLDWEAVILGFTGDNEPHAPNIWYVDGNLHMFNQAAQPPSQPISGRVVDDWEQKIADLYVAGARELDPEKRQVIYNEAQELISQYLPFIYLVNPFALGAVRNCFGEDIQYSALGGAFWNLEELQKNCP